MVVGVRHGPGTVTSVVLIHTSSSEPYAFGWLWLHASVPHWVVAHRS